MILEALISLGVGVVIGSTINWIFGWNSTITLALACTACYLILSGMTKASS